MKVVAIIPARGGSKRLPKKNIYPLFGKPLISWSIEACLKSKYIDEVYVSTEDKSISEVAQSHGVKVISRPADLADDLTPKMEAIRHADQFLQNELSQTADILVSVQANSPELKSTDIDKGIELLQENNLFEVITISEDMIQNASFRVIKQSCLYNTFLSAHIGVVINECTDVHTLEDIQSIEKKYTSEQGLTTFLQT